MNDLDKHIRHLLLDHNCVIVPNLGGFILQFCSARYDAEREVIFPPRYSVGFNPLLRINDGLLAQSYMKAHRITYEKAMQDIDQCVMLINAQLHENEIVDLTGVGSLRLNATGQIEFRPEKDAIESPELVELTPVALPRLCRKETEITPDTIEHEPLLQPAIPEANAPTHYVVQINRTWVHMVTAALVALLLCFLWSAPLNNGLHTGTQQARFFDVFSMPIPKAPADSISIRNHSEPSTRRKEQSASETVTARYTDTPVATEAFAIVVASRVSLTGANLLVDRLKKTGITSARITPMQHSRRVLCGKYATQKAAQQALRALRNENKDFAEAWITHI